MATSAREYSPISQSGPPPPRERRPRPLAGQRRVDLGHQHVVAPHGGAKMHVVDAVLEGRDLACLFVGVELAGDLVAVAGHVTVGDGGGHYPGGGMDVFVRHPGPDPHLGQFEGVRGAQCRGRKNIVEVFVDDGAFNHDLAVVFEHRHQTEGVLGQVFGLVLAALAQADDLAVEFQPFFR